MSRLRFSVLALALALLSLSLESCFACGKKYKSAHLTSGISIEPTCLTTEGGSFILRGDGLDELKKSTKVKVAGVKGGVGLSTTPGELECFVSGPLKLGRQEVSLSICKWPAKKTVTTTVLIIAPPTIAEIVNESLAPEEKPFDRGVRCGDKFSVRITGTGLAGDDTYVTIGPDDVPFFQYLTDVDPDGDEIRGIIADHAWADPGRYEVKVHVLPPGCSAPVVAITYFTLEQAECFDWSLESFTVVPSGPMPIKVEIGEFTDDEFNDVITGNTGIFVYRGDGTGTFKGTNGYSVDVSGAGSPRVRALAVGDLNGDGNDDVVWASEDAIWPLLQTDRILTLGASAGEEDDAIAVTIADLDGDGDQDIASISESNRRLRVFAGEGDGTFSMSFEHEFPKRQFPTGLTSGVIGRLDQPALLVGLRTVLDEPFERLVRFDWNAAGAGFEMSEVSANSMRLADLELTDLDPIPGPELAAAGSGWGVTYLGTFDGTGLPANQLDAITPPTTTLIEPGRFHSFNEHQQLALTAQTEAGSGVLFILLEPPYAHRLRTFPLLAPALDMAAGSLDGDDLDDLVIVDGINAPQVYRGR